MHPRQSLDTFRPVRPSRVYFISALPVLPRPFAVLRKRRMAVANAIFALYTQTRKQTPPLALAGLHLRLPLIRFNQPLAKQFGQDRSSGALEAAGQIRDA